ncbi:MAG: tryptophanase [Oscillospiraceae bacterium]|nr:tryptophanase [Oscillospiraceae bacterium]
MQEIKFYSGEACPLEMHKVRIVQRLNLLPIEDRVKAVNGAGNNTFLLQNKDTYLDMLTDSGVNAMSDLQLSAMMVADDSYAGSATYERLEEKLTELFGTKYFLPAHQGRACEHIFAKAYIKDGDVIPMNYHFTTTKAHIGLQGGKVLELYYPEALEVDSDHPFKGNMSPERLLETIAEYGVDRIPFVRMEAGTNLIGGQPFSLANLKEVYAICKANKIPLILDASLLADNLYFIKVREAEYRDVGIREITREVADNTDIIYFSARKLGHARGGGICTSDHDAYMRLRDLVPLFEGFLTYGGMSVREIEAITVGMEETMDYYMINQGPEFIKYMVDELKKRGIPVITPAGGLGCHLDAMRFLPHLPQSEYPAGALGSALFIAGGIRGMERGTISEEREADGSEHYSNMELLRLALPRRVFTLSQVNYAIDRITWLYENRDLVGGLKFTEEPKVLRFFVGRLAPVSDWQEKLVAKFKADFGESL